MKINIFFKIIISLSFLLFVNCSCPAGSKSSDPIVYDLLIVGDSINNEMPIVGKISGSACLIQDNSIANYYFQEGTVNTLPNQILGVEFSGQAVYNDDKYTILSYKFPSAILTKDSNSGLFTLTITNGKIYLKL
ncbi:hypothetical protein DICPUDRAFT_77618 [Dictyostelium purpureum]|uniref:Lipoprotein n=1 Tax=Dictyostelium purpureum TaxID=5786 RepID=F0ZH58_DICPU|nr:uncharacterized protein DICPUDRAFT_77618 [Dictyostelium purpureum]EGC36715.1 hypothetical protein DICPUDRAFT_77618 [Dictyostelium purpureum]|eukprot:XP_003286740.1 hypothetical protein DICPUDRAFT_77618 [Dictyostelium purpureum]